MDDSFKQSYTLDKGCKLNVDIAFKGRAGDLLSVLRTFSLRHVSTDNTIELLN